jgi:hypothetical protein
MKNTEMDETQLERFLEAARKLGTDNDKGRFEEKLGKVAKVKAKGIREDGAPKRPSKVPR